MTKSLRQKMTVTIMTKLSQWESLDTQQWVKDVLSMLTDEQLAKAHEKVLKE